MTDIDMRKFAENAGVNGRSPSGHAVPPVPAVMLTVEDVLKSGAYGELHGVKSAAAVYAPHRVGVVSAAAGPPSSCSLASVNGSCGAFTSIATICPGA